MLGESEVSGAARAMDDKRYDIYAVKEKLKSYGEMVKDYSNQCERLERLMIRLEGLGAQNITDMPKSPSPSNDRMSDLISQKIEIEEELGFTYKEIQEERRKMEKAIRSLRSADQRAVIRSRYIDRETYKEVTNLLFGDRKDYLDKEETYMRRTFQLHGEALVNLAAYYGLYKEIPDGKPKA